jgi:hypothetical protein
VASTHGPQRRDSKQQLRHEQILKVKGGSDAEQNDEVLFRSGGPEKSKDMLLRASHCLLTLSPMSKATEAHQNYVDAPLSHPNVEQSEYGDPADTSLQMSQLAIKEQQSSNIFKLPLQRKTRKDRQKQREDSTLDYQRKLGVKDKFNKRISCMSPDEYRSPRIKEFNSTGLQPTADASNRRSGEFDEVFNS